MSGSGFCQSDSGGGGSLNDGGKVFATTPYDGVGAVGSGARSGKKPRIMPNVFHSLGSHGSIASAPDGLAIIGNGASLVLGLRLAFGVAAVTARSSPPAGGGGRVAAVARIRAPCRSMLGLPTAAPRPACWSADGGGCALASSPAGADTGDGGASALAATTFRGAPATYCEPPRSIASPICRACGALGGPNIHLTKSCARLASASPRSEAMPPVPGSRVAPACAASACRMARSQSDTLESASAGTSARAVGQLGGGDGTAGVQPDAHAGHVVGCAGSGGGMNGCTGQRLAGIRSKMDGMGARGAQGME